MKRPFSASLQRSVDNACLLAGHSIRVEMHRCRHCFRRIKSPRKDTFAERHVKFVVQISLLITDIA